MNARVLLFLIVLFATLASPAVAAAEDPPKPAQLPQRQANFTWDNPQKGGPDRLLSSFSYVDVVDGAGRAKLANGLQHVIVMRAYLLRDGQSEPVALAARTCRVAYDLWNEVFSLKVSEAGIERNKAVLNVDGVLRECLEARSLFIAERPQLAPNNTHFLAVIVEVNPINPQMVEQMRQWVTRPAGSTGIGPGDALFGSFVGLFVKNIGKAERTLQFRTQPVPP
jgi:hypothetical protein